VTNQTLHLPIRDVILVIDDKVTNRRNGNSLRLVTIVTECALVAKLVFVTALTRWVAWDDSISEFFAGGNFLMARLTFDTDFSNMLLVRKLKEL
jgi:hypothetical protein